NDPLLQGTPELIDGLGAKCVKAKPARQCLHWIVLLTTPGAAGGSAIAVTQVPHDQRSLTELRPPPRRHNGLATSDHDPRQGICHRPAELRTCPTAQRLVDPLSAGTVIQQTRKGGARLGTPGSTDTPYLPKHRIEAVRILHSGRQKMENSDGVRTILILPRQRVKLIAQHLKHEPCVLFRIFDMTGLQTPVMIVFDEMVVGIARKGERVQPQGIDRRACDRRQPRADSSQMRQIMAKYVMTKQMVARGNLRLKLIQ